MSREAKAISQELRSLEAEETVVADAIEISNQALTASNDQIQRTKDMFTRVNTILSKAEQVRKTELAPLEKMMARSIEIWQQVVEKKSILKGIRSRLQRCHLR